MGATHLNTVTHKFQPQGVTAVTLLAESHMSIHTWQRKRWQCVMSLPVVYLIPRKVQFILVGN